MTHDADEIRGFSLQRSRAVNERLHALSSERHRDADGAQSGGPLTGPAFSESLLFDDHEMWLQIAARFDVGSWTSGTPTSAFTLLRGRTTAWGGWVSTGCSSSTRSIGGCLSIFRRSTGAERGRGHTFVPRTTHSREVSAAGRPLISRSRSRLTR
jgi:hypothetical protein